MPIQHVATVPILRRFDDGKAREFYIDWLGFKVDGEHRFELGLPLYMQVSPKAELQTFLSDPLRVANSASMSPAPLQFIIWRRFRRRSDGSRRLRYPAAAPLR